MDSNTLPNGVWPVMLTPFREDKEIDWVGYESLIEFYLEQGVVGLFATCGSSEAMHLGVEEMLALIERAVEVAAGRVPVVAGALVNEGPRSLASLVGRIREIGVEAVVLAPSVLVAEDEGEDVLRDRLTAVVEATAEIPLGIYEWPSPYHRLLSPEMFEWIAGTGRFIFHKDTCCDLETITKKLRRTQDSCLRFFNANRDTLIDSLAQGAHGYCGIGANWAPEAYVQMCLHATTNPAAAKELQALVMSLEGQLFSTPAYPLSAKVILKSRGVRLEPWCRNYAGQASTEDVQQLAELWAIFQQGFEEWQGRYLT